MKNILILEAGGPCAMSAIKILKKKPKYRLIGADMDPNASGLQVVDVAVTVPPSQDSSFPEVISNIIQMYQVDLVLPTFENGFKQLKHLNNDALITDFESALLCKDKYVFNVRCEEVGLPVPSTWLLDEFSSEVPYPIYIKPRSGVGSRNNFTAKNAQELDAIKLLIGDTSDYIVQELLSGDHWNVDVLVDKGEYVCSVCRRDLKQKDGNCFTVEIRNYAVLEEFAKNVATQLNIKSIFNLEVFEVTSGEFVINEINVRFGGGIIFGALAGRDFVSYLVTKDKSYLAPCKEAIYTRYYEEIEIK